MKAIFSFVFLFISFLLSAQTAQKTYLIKAGKFYDSEKSVFLKDQEILVVGNKIEKVGTKLVAPAGAEIINLPNGTVTPGLIDAHTHVLTIQKMQDPFELDLLMNSDIERTLRGAGICKAFLEAGFTTIRDLGNSGQFLDLNMKRAIKKGWIDGPRMIISGPILSPEDGQYFNLSSHNRHVIELEYRVIKNKEDARQAVKDHISKGADVIKVVMGDGRITLPVDEVKMIVETAHSFGIKVTAHATYDAVISKALDAGVDGIEHGYGISDSLLDRMAKQNVYLVPTIGDYDGYTRIFKENDKPMTPEDLKGLKEFVESSEAIVKKAIDKGVMVVNGSDMYLFNKTSQGDAAKNTLDTYFGATKNPAAVLKTATKNAAIACGVDEFTGVLKEKMTADIVVFDGDLEKDFIKTLYKVKLVMKEGKIYVR